MKRTLPILLLLSLLGTACGTRQQAAAPGDAEANAEQARDHLEVTASNYQFDQQVYHITQGVPTEITLTNKEGNHGLSIKELGVRLDGNHPSAVITAAQTGTFEMSCSIPCGPGHKNMKATLIVDQPK